MLKIVSFLVVIEQNNKGLSCPLCTTNQRNGSLQTKLVAFGVSKRETGSLVLENNGSPTFTEREDYAETVVSGGVQDAYGEDTATEDQPVTPWAVSVARYLLNYLCYSHLRLCVEDLKK